MEEENGKCTYFLEGYAWISKLVYLADIFIRLNLVNCGLQKPSEYVLTSTNKLSAFQEKMTVLWTNLDQGNTVCSHCSGQGSNLAFLVTISIHLQELQISLKYYLSDLNREQYDWVRNPFVSMLQTDEVQLKAVKLKNDWTLQFKFKEVSFNSFSVTLHNEYFDVRATQCCILVERGYMNQKSLRITDLQFLIIQSLTWTI